MKNKAKNNITYHGGVEQFKGFIRLSSNENNYGPPNKVKKAISNSAKYSHIYPELNSQSLILKIANFNKINKDNIIVGAGSDEILQMIIQAFTKPGDYVMYTKYSFAMYRVLANSFHCKSIIFNDKNFQFNLKDFLKLYTPKVKIIFLANPNNPTGSIFYKRELIEFLNKINKKTIVVLDSAYSEYILDKNYTDGIDLVSKFSNLIITKTFSKVFALGGLRVGWGFTSKNLIRDLYLIKKPFNVSRVGADAASLALNNTWINKQVFLNNFHRSIIMKKLKNPKLELIETLANFILIKLPSEKEAILLNNFTMKNKITIRSLKSYGLPNYLRMSIGTLSEVLKVIKVLKSF